LILDAVSHSKKLSFCEGQESAHKRMKWFSNEL
jgi:hypothetical protein